MHNKPYPSRASASCRSARTSCKTWKQQKASKHCPSDYQCKHRNCKARFSCQSDLLRHEEFVHAGKQQCPFAQCEYMTGNMDKMKDHMRNWHGLSSKFYS